MFKSLFFVYTCTMFFAKLVFKKFNNLFLNILYKNDQCLQIYDSILIIKCKIISYNSKKLILNSTHLNYTTIRDY